MMKIECPSEYVRQESRPSMPLFPHIANLKQISISASQKLVGCLITFFMINPYQMDQVAIDMQDHAQLYKLRACMFSMHVLASCQ